MPVNSNGKFPMNHKIFIFLELLNLRSQTPRESLNSKLELSQEPYNPKLYNLLNPKLEHITGGSSRSARRSGRERSGTIECQQNYSPRKQKSTVLSKASKKRRFNVSPEARISEILCKPMEEQNHRLTRGSSAVYSWFISRMRSALCFWLPTSGTMPCGLHTCRIQNPDISRADQVEAPDGAVGRNLAR